MADFEGGGENSVGRGRLFEWVLLPLPVQENIFEYLDPKTVNRMRETCRETQHIIDREYGIHVKLPARNLSDIEIRRGLPIRNGQHITDALIEAAVLAMEGKVIRSLEMFQAPARVNPFQFERFIQRPMRLRDLHLEYIDIRLIHTFLTSCRNLATLQYETGTNIISGFTTTLLPHQIPSMDEQLIGIVQELPALAQLARLTSLTLSMKNLFPARQSDWANPLHLFLVMPSSAINLKRISFSMASAYLLLKCRVQILAIFGEFLARTPSLQHVEFLSDTRISILDNRQSVPQELPQNVLTSLINRNGSDLLKSILPTLGPDDILDTAREIVQQIMRAAARNLGKLETFELKLGRWELESIVYRSFIWGLASLRNFLLNDLAHSLVRDNNDLYHLIVGEVRTEGRIPLWFANLERLHIKRTFDDDPIPNRTVSLVQILERMKNLKHLNVEGKKPGRQPRVLRQYSEREEPTEDEDNVLINVVERVKEQPELTIRPRTVDQSIFQNLETLELSNVSLMTRDVASLKTWRSLKRLSLDLVVGYWHSYFGINSGDLVELIVSLRKLDRLFVSPVYFPSEEVDASLALAEAHYMTLRQLGRLTMNLGYLYNPNYWSFRFGGEVPTE